MAVITGTALAVGALIAALAGGSFGLAQGSLNANQRAQRAELIQKLMAESGMSRPDAESMVEEFIQEHKTNPFQFGKSDEAYNEAALWDAWKEYQAIKDKFVLPELPDTAKIRAEAEAEAEDLVRKETTGLEDEYKLNAANTEAALRKLFEDNAAEYQQLFNANQDTYNLLAENTRNELQNQLLENNAMFQDYRNQVLTENAMATQAIAGSTRYELERAQRNAISRGASAAQRLVSNINAQLGIQAQAAQQSLNTSNVLAQQLLAQRQAATQLRGQYLDSQMDLAKNQLANRNQYSSNLTSNRTQYTKDSIANQTALSNNLTTLRNRQAERLTSLKSTMGNAAVSKANESYNSAYERYQDLLSGYQDNPFVKYGQQQASRNRYNNGI